MSFEQIYRDHFTRLCRLAYRMLGDGDVAEDIVQSVFLRIWEKDSLSHIDQPAGYLKKAVINACLNHLDTYFSKHVIRIDQIEEPVAEESKPADLSVFQVQLDMAIRRLPPKCQVIFTLSRFEGMTSAEIATYLKASTRTVENQIGIALSKLRVDLQPFYPTLEEP
ncbi:MAG: RNA polymerase sigma-70 factor [Cytophagales bacterium]|nr:RNA polymerase sigma-70 factor [Cytophagales bacterium]